MTAAPCSLQTRESCFIRSKQSPFKRALEMKPDFFFPWSQSPFSLLWEIVEHFFSLCFPSSLVFPAHFSSGVHQWPKPHGQFDQQYCSKASNICPNSEDSFVHMLSHASCHLSGKQTCLCCKKMFKEDEKYVFVCRKIELDLGRGEKMQSWRNNVSQGMTQTSLGSLRDAPVLNLNTTEKQWSLKFELLL